MTSAAFDPVAPADNSFESWARALCQFVIRAAILPVTLLFTKPSAFLRATETGEYRPLPSPFLLALITGIVLSGVTSNISKFSLVPNTDGSGAVTPNSEFVTSVINFYMSMNGVNTILYAIPYVFALWLFAGLISLFMFRGIRTAEALMTAISFCLTALVELTIIMVGVILLFNIDQDTTVLIMAGAFLAYTLVVAVKLIRLLFVIRRQRGAPLVGAILASVPSLLIVSVTGLVGAALAVSVHSERGYIAETAYQDAYNLGRGLVEERDFVGAVAAYDRAIAIQPTAEAYNSRCWARGMAGIELQLAVMDCDASLALDPGAPSTLDSRALAQLRLENFDAAYADYSAALELEPRFAHALYGRGLAQLRRGNAEEGQADIAAALELEPGVDARYARYGVTANAGQRSVSARPEPAFALPQHAPPEPEAEPAQAVP
jgi:tetratricopeptide (TPR) repeat protein